jgi:hypothetical protein
MAAFGVLELSVGHPVDIAIIWFVAAAFIAGLLVGMHLSRRAIRAQIEEIVAFRREPHLHIQR